MNLKSVIAPTLLATVSAALLIQLPIAIADRTDAYDFLDPVIDVRQILVRDFVDAAKIDDQAMRQGMIEGMIETLGDPYTVYVPPADRTDFDKELRGTYVGIGCEVNMVEDQLTIISPMDGSPALEVGVMAGDVVLEIEGQSITGLPIDECINRLMGEPGTNVRIKVRHLDGAKQEYTITRRRINTRTVRGIRRDGENWNYCVDEKLGLSYVRVTQFNDSTSSELLEALDSLQKRGLNGLILDLRDNPGGGLTVATQMADLFLNAGNIVSIQPRPGRGEAAQFSAKAPGTLPDFPLLVMINGQSASASEIVSGALQDNGRAKVLGTRSYGKGSVQDVRELDFNRGTLKFTTAHYHLPSGRNINRDDDSEIWGVDPDPGMVVAMSDKELLEMFRARREFEIIRAADPSIGSCADVNFIQEKLKDNQLVKAVEALRARVESGNWPAVGGDNAAVVAFDTELKRAVDRRGQILEALGGIEDRISQLHQQAAEVGKPPLLPPEIDLQDGTLTVRDKLGNVVGTYRIDAGNLELALDTMRLTPVDGEK